MILVFFLVPLTMMLFEVLGIGMLVFAGVSHPFGGVSVGASLGLHPILGIAAGLWAAYLYLHLYRSKIAATVLGLLWTLMWGVIGLSMANDTPARDFKWHVQLLQQLWAAHGDWHQMPAQLARLRPGIALWYVLASVGWHFAVYAAMRAPAAAERKLGWSGADLRQRGRYVVALFFIAALCWLVGWALSNA